MLEEWKKAMTALKKMLRSVLILCLLMPHQLRRRAKCVKQAHYVQHSKLRSRRKKIQGNTDVFAFHDDFKDLRFGKPGADKGYEYHA